MISKTGYYVERPKFYVPKNNNEKAIKVHGYIYSLLSREAANCFHDENIPKPFSIEYYDGSKNSADYLFINILTDQAEEIISAINQAGEIIFQGAKKNCAIEIEKKGFYSRNQISKLMESPYITIKLLTPATYRIGKYCCWFDLDQLLKTPIEKIRYFFGLDFSFEDSLMSQIRIIDYDIKSKPYHINGIINGMVGYVKFEIINPEIKEKLCELLSFCEFTGLGSKTSLGMGGCRIEYSDNIR